jgi:hypothetical protein
MTHGKLTLTNPFCLSFEFALVSNSHPLILLDVLSSTHLRVPARAARRLLVATSRCHTHRELALVMPLVWKQGKLAKARAAGRDRYSPSRTETQLRPTPRLTLAQQKRVWLLGHVFPFRASTGEADTVVAKTERAAATMDLVSMLTVGILVGVEGLRD